MTRALPTSAWDEHEVRQAVARAGRRWWTATKPVDELSHALQCATHAMSAGLRPSSLWPHCSTMLPASPGDPPCLPRHARTSSPALSWLASRTSEQSGLAGQRPTSRPRSTWWRRTPSIRRTLSPESVLSLRHQNEGPPPDHASSWRPIPWWPEALDLRRWDDAAKVPAQRTAGLDEIFDQLGPFARREWTDRRVAMAHED
jgi:hypothetical protein